LIGGISVNTLSKNEIIEALKTHFKIAGFKKLSSNWFKETKDTVLVFNVQSSQWGLEYYINLGIYIKALGDELKPPVYRCHIQCRIEHEDYNNIQKIVVDSLEWFYKHDKILKLKQLSNAKKLPLMTFVEAHKFLETVSIVE
jgi:hypothetical protein